MNKKLYTPVKLILLALLLPLSFTGHAQDTDGDGVANAADRDDDNDGILDIDEMTCNAGKTGVWALIAPLTYRSTVGAGPNTVTVTFTPPAQPPAPVGAYVTGFGAQTMSALVPAWFSDASVAGHASFSITCWWDIVPEGSTTDIDNLGNDKVNLTMTINFGSPVTDPVLHFDRLGGHGAPFFGSPVSNSGRLTVTTPGVTCIRLSGTTDFDVTATTIQRTPDVVGVSTNSESGTGILAPGAVPITGQAAGSVMFTGTFTILTFSYTGVGVEGIGNDGVEFVYGARYCTDLNSDADGIPDRLDLDSDADVCPDVSEANYTDGDLDGILGSDPTIVNAVGQVIGTLVSDGYLGNTPEVIDGIPANTPICNQILPAELCAFDVAMDRCTSLVKWLTCSESGLDCFIIQRSSNGLDWMDIAKVEAQEYSEVETDYQYIDEDIFNHTNYYYRLVEMDMNGGLTFSHAKSLQVDCKPSDNNLIITQVDNMLRIATFDKSAITSLQFTSMTGAKISSETFEILQNEVMYSTSDLSAGVYFVECLTSNNQRMTKRIVIR